MRIIFLDFDGVLNSPATWGNIPRDRAIDADKVARLARLVEQLDASVVLSTSWKHGHGYDDLRDLLEAKGLPRQRIIGVTPNDEHGRRGVEIEAWIAAWLPEQRPTFAILDDMGLTSFEGLGQHLVQVDGSQGLTDRDCESVTQVIEGRA